MSGIIRIVLIVVAVIAAAAGIATFALPARSAATSSIDVSRPTESVFARLASASGVQIAPGVTQTVTEAVNNVVTADLAFPEGQTGRAVYTVSREGDHTNVDVRIESPLALNPVARVQGLTGAPAQPYLEAAVASVTTDLNALSANGYTGLAYDVVTVEGRPFFFNENCSPQDAEAIREAVAASLVGIRPIMQRYGLAIAGDPVAVETSWTNNQYCFQVRYPYSGTPPRVLGMGRVGQTPAGQAIRVRYTGPEENVLPLYDQMEAMMAAARLEQGRSFEIYFDDPTQSGGSVTREVYYLIASGDIQRLQRLAPSAAQPAAAAAPAAAPAAPAAPVPAAPAPPEAAPAAPAPAAPAPAQ